MTQLSSRMTLERRLHAAVQYDFLAKVIELKDATKLEKIVYSSVSVVATYTLPVNPT